MLIGRVTSLEQQALPFNSLVQSRSFIAEGCGIALATALVLQ